MSARILVAGVGNVLLGDDGFGVEVAGRLIDDPPGGAHVVDFGIRGIQLAYQLLEGYDLLVLIDAMARGAAPGTVYVFEPDEPNPASATWLDAHSLDPASVLSMVHMLGGSVGRTVVVGCEPGELGEGIGLSAPVAAAVEEAIRVVRRLVAGEGRRAEDSREETSW